MPKIFVICGTHQEFLDFAKQKVTQGWPSNTSLSLSDFIHVRDHEVLRGYTNPTGFFVGTWRKNKQLREILIQLSISYHDIPMHDNLKKIINEVLSS